MLNESLSRKINGGTRYAMAKDVMQKDILLSRTYCTYMITSYSGYVAFVTLSYSINNVTELKNSVGITVTYSDKTLHIAKSTNTALHFDILILEAIIQE